VSKADNRLEAFSSPRLIKTNRAAVGGGGEGDKRFEGDGRTPEGSYRIDSRHRSARFHRFLHISYPNREDRRRFRAARRRGDVPTGRGIGSAIGIHGTPGGFGGLPHTLGFDWTAGCVAVSNGEIEELFRAVRPNAVIQIRP